MYKIQSNAGEIKQCLEAEQEEESKDEEYACENCQGESCNSYQGCTASIDASQIPPPEYNPDDVAFKIPVGNKIGEAYSS